MLEPADAGAMLDPTDAGAILEGADGWLTGFGVTGGGAAAGLA